MAFTKKFIIGITLIALASNGLTAIQVLPASPSPLSGFAEGFTQGFNRSFGPALEQGRRQREQEKLQKKYKEQMALLENLLQGYTPAENSTYVLRILQSELPADVKELVIGALNEQHRMYLEEQKKKSIFSWFNK